jgi:hypothetical protein
MTLSIFDTKCQVKAQGFCNGGGCARIEQAVGKLKRFALRSEKTKRYFALIAGFILVKSVHTA